MALVTTHDLVVNARSYGIPRVQAEINSLYRSQRYEVQQLTGATQRLGHHSLETLQIFKGLALYRGFGYITQALGAGVQEAIDFEKNMAKVSSIVDMTGDQIKNLGSYIADLGKTIPVTMNDLALGMYDVASAGYEQEAQIKLILELSAKAAVAGQSNIRTTVQAGIGAMNAFGKTLGDLEHIYDVQFMTVKLGIFEYEQFNQTFGRVSASASLAAQTLEVATGAMVAISRGGFGGAAFEEGATRVTNFFQQLSETSVQTQIEALGIAVFDSFGKMRNAIDIVADLNAKLAVMTDQARQATTNQIFTNIRSAQGFEVLAKQIDTWREATLKNVFAGGAMETAYQKQTKTVAALLTKLQNQFTESMTAVVAQLAPILEGLGRLFTNLGQNMIPLGMILGTLALNYMRVYVAGKYLDMQQAKEAITFEMNRLAIEKMNLARQRELQYLDLEAAMKVRVNDVTMKTVLNKYLEEGATNKVVIAAYKENAQAVRTVLAKYTDIQVTDGQISANAKLTIELQKQQMVMRERSVMMVANAIGVIAMTGSILAMASGNEIATKAFMGMTISITTFQAILPIVTTLMTAFTASAWGAAIGLTAASAGTAALGIAAGVAIVLGVAATSMISFGTAANDSATSVTSLTDAMTGMEDQQQTLKTQVDNLVSSLIKQGRSIGYITEQVKTFIETAQGTNNLGFLSGLATQNFGMYEGVGIVRPKLAETTSAAQTATSLGLGAEYLRGSMADILKFQEVLKGMVTSTDIWTAEIGKLYTTNIFGTEFGSSLITLWEDYGMELQNVDAEHKETFEAAQKYVQGLAEDIKAAKFQEALTLNPIELGKKLGLTIESAGNGAYKQYTPTPPMPGAGGAGISALTNWLLHPTTPLSEADLHTMRQTYADMLTNSDNAYLQTQKVLGNWLTLSTNVDTTVAQTAEQIRASIEENIKSWTDALGEAMSFDTIVTSLTKAGTSLDEAGFYFRGVAGNWDTLGKEWAIIQRKWAAVQMLQTLLSVSDALVSIPTTLTNMTGGSSTSGLDFTALQEQIYAAVAPILAGIMPSLATDISDIIGAMFGNLGSGDFWDAFISGVDDTEQVVEETIAEMAQKFIDDLNGAGGFSDAIQQFVESGTSLENAGFLFREVAGGWQALGEEWGRIQAYFKVTEFINSFIQSTSLMRQYGVSIPETFEQTMFDMMQVMSSLILPDFQSVIDALMDNVGSANFWEALAEGMSEAKITQSNSITLAPYIVISERADAEQIVGVVHDALVEEAKRAGFSWGNG